MGNHSFTNNSLVVCLIYFFSRLAGGHSHVHEPNRRISDKRNWFSHARSVLWWTLTIIRKTCWNSSQKSLLTSMDGWFCGQFIHSFHPYHKYCPMMSVLIAWYDMIYYYSKQHLGGGLLTNEFVWINLTSNNNKSRISPSRGVIGTVGKAGL